MFVGGDPENIKTVIKVRGISINSSSDDTVTFNTLKHTVLSDDKKIYKCTHCNTKFSLTGVEDSVTSIFQEMSGCFNQRRRIDKERTVPFGYKDTLFYDKDYSLL